MTGTEVYFHPYDFHDIWVPRFRDIIKKRQVAQKKTELRNKIYITPTTYSSTLCLTLRVLVGRGQAPQLNSIMQRSKSYIKHNDKHVGTLLKLLFT